jgi:low molecular weight protein-tyrosine phosphatase
VLSHEGNADPASQAARVSFICTANRARSPFAAALLGGLVSNRPIVVDSFGVLEQGEAPALPGAVRAALEFGIDLSGHHARALHPGDLVTSDLAIGFEPVHVAAAVETGGIPAERAFLLVELADVLEVDVLPWPAGSDSLPARVAHANARRFAGGRVPRSVSDPVGQSDRQFERTYDEIARCVGIVGMRLFSAGAVRTV